MRIAYDARWLHVSETIAYNRYLIGLLSRLQQQPDIEILLFTDQAHPIHPNHLSQLGRCKSIVIPSARELVWEQVKVPLMLRQCQVDVFHEPADVGLALIKPCPYLLTCHGVPWKPYICDKLKTGAFVGTANDYLGDLKPTRRGVSRFYTQWRGIFRRHLALSRADRIISVSDSLKKDLKTYLNIATDRVHTIYEAPDDMFRRTAVPSELLKVRQKYNIPDRYIINVGTIARHKNTESLLRIFADVKRYIRDLALVCCAQWSREFEAYQDLCKALGLHLDKDVFFLDKVSQDLPILYQGARAFILLSWYESFSFPVTEAMASGLPVIASNLACLPEIVASGGLLVDPRQPHQVVQTLLDVLGDTRRQERLRQHALARARDFSWDQAAQQTLDVYRAVA